MTLKGKLTKRRVCVLVKAYPQQSRKYEETVCCAGIDVDNNELVRLYPIRYRHLPDDAKFERFDVIEIDVWHADGDHRPESYKVSEDSIKVIQKKAQTSRENRVKAWLPFVSESLPALEMKNIEEKASLGIIRPDPGSLKFLIKENKDSSNEEKELEQNIYNQMSLFSDPLKPLEKPTHSFYYKFTSGEKEFNRKIFDWEVQAAHVNYKKRYGKIALDMLTKEYQDKIPNQNLHFLLGTALAHPRTFMIIGILRTTVDVPTIGSHRDIFS